MGESGERRDEDLDNEYKQWGQSVPFDLLQEEAIHDRRVRPCIEPFCYRPVKCKNQCSACYRRERRRMIKAVTCPRRGCKRPSDPTNPGRICKWCSASLRDKPQSPPYVSPKLKRLAKKREEEEKKNSSSKRADKLQPPRVILKNG